MKKKLLRSISLLMAALMIISSSSVSTLAETLSYAEAGDAEVYEYEEIENLGSEEPVSSSVTDISSSEILPEEEEIKEEEIKTELPDVSENTEEETEPEEDVSENETFDAYGSIYTGTVKVAYKNSKNKTVTKTFKNDDIVNAIEIACANNGTITLASTVLINSDTAFWEFNSGKVTVNLGSYSFKPAGDHRSLHLMQVNNNSDVTLKGSNAKMVTDGFYLVKATGNSTLTVDGINFTSPAYAFSFGKGVTFNMKSGTVNAVQPIAFLNEGTGTGQSTFNMYKGKITAKTVGIFAEDTNINIFGGEINLVPSDSEDTAYFHGGKISFSAIQATGSRINISGGTLSCKTDTNDLTRSKTGIIMCDSDFKLSGGTISVESNGRINGIYTESSRSAGTTATGSITITGGLIKLIQTAKSGSSEIDRGILVDYHELNMTGGTISIDGGADVYGIVYKSVAPKGTQNITGGTIKCVVDGQGFGCGIYTDDEDGTLILGKVSIAVNGANTVGIWLGGGTAYLTGTDISVSYNEQKGSSIAGIYLGADTQLYTKDAKIKVTSNVDYSKTGYSTSALGITNYRGSRESQDNIVSIESSDITVSSGYYAAGINLRDTYLEVYSSNISVSGCQSVYGVDLKAYETSYSELWIFDSNIDVEIKKLYKNNFDIMMVGHTYDIYTGIHGINTILLTGQSAYLKRNKINLHGGKGENAPYLSEYANEIEGYGISVSNGTGISVEGNAVKCNTDLSIPHFTGNGIVLAGIKGTDSIKDNSVYLRFTSQNRNEDQKAGIYVAGVSDEERAEKLKFAGNVVNVKNYFNSTLDDYVYGILATNTDYYELSDNDVLLENIKDAGPVSEWSVAHGIRCRNGNEVLSVGNKITVNNSGKDKDSYFAGSLFGHSTQDINKIVNKKLKISVTGYNYKNNYALYMMNGFDVIIEDSDIQGINSMSPSNAEQFSQALGVTVCGAGRNDTSVTVKNCMLKGTTYAISSPKSRDHYTLKVIDSTMESTTAPAMMGTGNIYGEYIILSGKVVLRNPQSMFLGIMELDNLFVTDKGDILPADELRDSGAKEVKLYDPVFSSVEITAPNKVYQGLKDGKFSVEIEFRNDLSYMVKPGTVVWKINGNTVESAAITKTSTEMLVENFDSLSYVSFGENEITWSADIIFEGGEQHYEAHKKFNYYPTVTFYAYDSAYLSSPTLVDACSFADGTKEKTTYAEKGKSVAVEDIPTFTPLGGGKFSFKGWVDAGGQLLTGGTVINTSKIYYACYEADGLTIRKLSPQTTYTSENINTVVKDVVYQPGRKIVLEDILPSSEYGIYYGDNKLTTSDYKVTYKYNDRVTDSAKVTITGKGKYKGQISFTYNIVPFDLSYVVDESSVEHLYKYTGKNISLKGFKLQGFPKVSLKNGKDYKLTYYYFDKELPGYVPATSMKKDGDYTVTLNGIGNYKGSYPFLQKFTVSKKTPITSCKIYGITDLKYTGDACTFDESKIVLKYKNKRVPAEYYSLVYHNNDRIGTAYFEIRASSDSPYIGSIYTSFNIYGVRLDNKYKEVRFEWVDDVQNLTYQNEVFTPAFKLYNTNGTADTADDILLTSGVDYSYNFYGKDGLPLDEADTSAGKVTLKIVGKGSYSGTYIAEYTVKPLDLAKAYAMNARSFDKGKITLEGQSLGGSYDVIYNKESNKPSVKLVMGMGPGNSPYYLDSSDYSISYKNYSKAGKAYMTITGKNNLKGKIKVYYNISKAKLSYEDGFDIYASDVEVNSKPGKYATTVKVEWNGKVLSKGKDYDSKFTYTDRYGNTLTSKSKPKVGDVINVTIKGKGNYTGSLTAKYVIVKKTLKSVKASTITKRYTGSNIILTEKDLASMKIKIGTKKLVYNKDYVISGYKNNINTGTATVTITGIGDYSGSKDISFKISQATFKWWIRN